MRVLGLVMAIIGAILVFVGISGKPWREALKIPKLPIPVPSYGTKTTEVFGPQPFIGPQLQKSGE